jgi:uncharacterized membrane protein (GlpM family)
MLALKLLLVPLFLLIVSLVSKRFGPSVGGWIAGLPVVAGPILGFIALERGAAFAATAAATAAAGVFAAVCFGLVYARASASRSWPVALALALAAWGIAAGLLHPLPSTPLLGAAIAAASLLAAPRLFPRPSALPLDGGVTRAQIVLRMVAGALLTLLVTLTAASLGARWSGLLAVFPLLSAVLAVSSHRSQGAAFAGALLRAMVTGLYSFAAFCVALSLTLAWWPLAWAFGAAVAAGLLVQAATMATMQRQIQRQRLRPATLPATSR